MRQKSSVMSMCAMWSVLEVWPEKTHICWSCWLLQAARGDPGKLALQPLQLLRYQVLAVWPIEILVGTLAE